MFRRGGENLGVELLLCSTLVPLTFFRKCTPAGASVPKVGQFLRSSQTDGFMVLHQGRIVTECYFNDLKQNQPHILTAT